MSTVSEIIRKRREYLGLTLEEVGNAVGVGKSTVRKWENGIIKNMGRDKIMALAKVLQIKPIDIVQDDLDTSLSDDLSSEEYRLIDAWRAADDRAREDAMKTLLNHPREKENPAAV